jgi:hypothetical protein
MRPITSSFSGRLRPEAEHQGGSPHELRHVLEVAVDRCEADDDLVHPGLLHHEAADELAGTSRSTARDLLLDPGDFIKTSMLTAASRTPSSARQDLSPLGSRRPPS